ncbi:cytochrome c-type biogenesis protein CcsB [Flavobacterium caeni]|uniref:Cytochrome c-type biogenesis protein CcsB n=2 Tax=Flavobacterium caeni TaxID=490189 RepID=A0A1G5BPF7_9FLAO|nr:cytochrome c-type biogenesis protein CcsB [Flavobacterium caeni]
MAVLFLSFAAAMAAGTFIEDAYNTDTARIWVYNTRWFEAMMLLFMINFIGNIKRYQLYKKEKWATLILHLAFILIIAGAFVTRYISYEGMMPIREGEAANQIYSDKTYLTVLVDGQYQGALKRRVFEEPLLFSPVANNDFTVSEKFADTPFEIEFKKYIMGATETVEPKENGTLYLKMVESGGGTRHEHFLQSGEVANIHNVLFALNKFTQGAVNINTTGGVYTIQAPFEGQFMRMADQFQGKVVKDSTQQLMMRSLYNVGGAQFVFPEPAITGVKAYKSNEDIKAKQHDDAITMTISSQGQEREVTVIGGKGKQGEPQSLKIGGLDFTVFFGSKVYTTPFQVQLNDFIATKYPGTEKSYAAFESQVTVLDPEKKFDARIYMNHVLDHKGYRFFQASFDPDEKGTILSVNHDYWGTWITYIGYFALFFGMLAILFTKHSRFGDLRRKLDAVKAKKAKLMGVLLLFLSLGATAQTQDSHEGHDHASHDHSAHNHEATAQKPITAKEIDSLLGKYKVTEAHAAQFGRLVIQDEGGRMKPVNTFSSELLRKVSKKDTYGDMNSDQVFLSMTQYPAAWFEVPLIYLKSGNDSIRKLIGIGKDDKYAPFIKFFDERGNYKLSPYLDAAYKAAVPDQFQKDFIEADKRVNLLNSALSGSILRIFPIPNDANNKWVSYLQLSHAGLKGIDSTFTRQILPLYLTAAGNAVKTGNYKEADFYLKGINKFQHRYGAKVMPSDEKIDSEILYNKYDIFKKLYYWYMLSGVLMLLFAIVQIFSDNKPIRWTINFFHILIGFFFLLHTGGLVLRWYISGHAPWSDAYESMIYVAWATMFFTLMLARKSKLTVASGTFVASMILMIAHWNWMDPAIANLQPVLNSYWLMIHVAVIVASYGPFTLGMVLGLVAMLLMLFVNDENKKKMELNIKELTYINEMALTIGLVMLTIGNFLGGQWANESWGRYWGWDPKETWALISIMVYAFVIHMRFVPALRGKFTYNFFAVLAFASILMTYFGVNFHLSGLHSYASGERQNAVIYGYILAGFLLFSVLVYWRYRKFKGPGVKQNG